MSSNHLGDVLFEMRRRRRLLQKTLAADAGIEASYLAGLERGRRRAPSHRVLERLLKALGATSAEREEVRHAIAVGRLERELCDGPLAENSELIVRIADLLPDLDARSVQMLEILADLLTCTRTRGGGAM